MYTISLPIADRRTSHDFYRAAFGLETVGEPGGDGLPEPLQFALSPDVNLMLVPTGGFEWVLAGRGVAPPDQRECVLGRGAASPAEVDALTERARDAGAGVLEAPADKPWGYSATIADPDGHLWMLASE